MSLLSSRLAQNTINATIVTVQAHLSAIFGADTPTVVKTVRALNAELKEANPRDYASIAQKFMNNPIS